MWGWMGEAVSRYDEVPLAEFVGGSDWKWVKSIIDYGLDSMVGSQLLVWVSLEMKFDVSFIG